MGCQPLDYQKEFNHAAQQSPQESHHYDSFCVVWVHLRKTFNAVINETKDGYHECYHV